MCLCVFMNLKIMIHSSEQNCDVVLQVQPYNLTLFGRHICFGCDLLTFIDLFCVFED